jgi:hypothetical protein
VQNHFKRNHRFNFALWVLFAGAQFLVSACDPKPCLRTPESRLTVEWIPRIDLVDDTFGLVEFQDGRTPKILLATNLPKSDSSLFIHIPYQPSFQKLTITRTDSLILKKLEIRSNAVLRFAGETCGFYEGFEKLQFTANPDDFQKIQILREGGDSTKTIHIRVYE